MDDLAREGPALLAFAAVRYALAAAIALAAFVVGRALTRGVSFGSRAERIVVCTTLGLGAIGLILFALGVAHLLTRAAALAAIAAALVVSWLARPRGGAPAGGTDEHSDPAPPPSRRHLPGVAVAVALLLLLAPALLLPLYPPIAWDAIGYHLPHAKLDVEAGRLVINPYLRYPVFPLLNEMVFALALLLADDVLAQLTQFLMLGALVGGIFVFGRRAVSERAGFWAAALFAGNSQVLWLGSIAYVDVGVTLFTTMAAFAFWSWRSTRRTEWIALAGALCGFAAGTKYLGLVVAAFLGACAAFDASRARTLRPALVFGAAFGAVAAPWYFRSALCAGNPVFPFLPSVFGYSFWSREDLAWLDSDVIKNHGVGRSVKALATLPWSLAFRQIAFDAEARISPAFGLAIPILLAAAVRLRAVRYFAVLGVAYALFWFSSAQILRYLLPALPFLSLAIAATADRLLARAGAIERWTASRAFACAVAAALAWPGWSYAVSSVRERGLPPTSTAGRRAFVVENRPSYPAYEYLNATRGRNYAVYAYREQCMTYFADGLFVGDYFGPGRYPRVEACWDDGEALYRTLRELGVTHLLVSSWYGKARVPSNEAFNRRFRVVFARANATLFELAAAPLAREVGANRLVNPGFEARISGPLDGWQKTGSPTVETRAERADAGPSVVVLRGERECVFEDVTVEPGEQCLLRCRAQSDAGGQALSLTVVWYDASGRQIGVDPEVSAVGGGWQMVRLLVTAPAAASVARVVVSPYRASTVRVDDVHFSDLSYEPAPTIP